MPSITGINDAGMRCSIGCNEVSCTTVSMPNNEHVNMHGLKVAQGIKQGFALDGTGLCDVDIQYIGRQSFCRQFKRRTGTCAGLEKEIDDGFSTQQWYLFYSLFCYAGKGFCCIEYLCQ